MITAVMAVVTEEVTEVAATEEAGATTVVTEVVATEAAATATKRETKSMEVAMVEATEAVATEAVVMAAAVTEVTRRETRITAVMAVVTAEATEAEATEEVGVTTAVTEAVAMAAAATEVTRRETRITAAGEATTAVMAVAGTDRLIAAFRPPPVASIAMRSNALPLLRISHVLMFSGPKRKKGEKKKEIMLNVNGFPFWKDRGICLLQNCIGLIQIDLRSQYMSTSARSCDFHTLVSPSYYHI